MAADIGWFIMCSVAWMNKDSASKVWNEYVVAHAVSLFASICNWGVKCVVLGMMCWEKECITGE